MYMYRQERSCCRKRGTSRTTLSRIRFLGSRFGCGCLLQLVLCVFLLHVVRDDVHLLPFCVNALTPRPVKSREARYFTEQCLIPPLQPLPCFGNATLHSNKIHLGPLPVVYTNDPKTVSRWLSENLSLGPCMIGFDLESVPEAPWVKRKASFRGPAVVQLATTCSALVIHLAKASGRPSRACAPSIESILRDPDIVKAGCAIDQDFIELRGKWKELEARTRFEMGGIGGDNAAVTGLRTLCANVLHLELPKSQRLATSDWSQLPLTNAQLAYCARDAWAGAAVAAELEALLPETFSAAALSSRLRSQRTLKDLTERQWNRKQAKRLLISLRTPYSLSEKKRISNAELPEWKKDIVRDLKKVIRENRYDGLEVYDTVELGLEAMVNRTV